MTGKKTQSKEFVYISSWTHGGEEAGLHVYLLGKSSGRLTDVQHVDTEVSFNMTYVDKKRKILYALNEAMRLPEMRAGGGGQIYVYSMDPDTGKLTLRQKKPTWCPNPSYMTLDADGRYAVVANHASGAAATQIFQDAYGEYHLKIEYDDSVVELFEVCEDGTLGRLLDVDKHFGDGPEARQLRPRPHSAVMSPDGRLFAVCDKGNDTVSLYQIDREKQKLRLTVGAYNCEAGSLPRYCVFHPNRPFFYHNNEKSMDLCAYHYDPNGVLTPVFQRCAAPSGWKPRSEKNEQQGLCIRADGRILYDVVRGPNVISVFSLDQETGEPTLKQTFSVSDSWPRGCALDDTGDYLIVCGLGEGQVFLYRLNETGEISMLCETRKQPFAAYVSFWNPGWNE